MTGKYTKRGGRTAGEPAVPAAPGAAGGGVAAGPGASHRRSGVQRLSRLGLLTAAAITLSLLERLLPPPAPVPGVRWGLANAVTLAALALEGPGAAFLVWLVRFLLVGVLSGSLFAPAFFVGGAGGLLAWAAMAALSRQPWLGAAGVSVAGALAHHIGQIAGAAAVTAAPGVFLLLPPLLLLAVPVGLLTGTLVGFLLRRLRAARVVGRLASAWLDDPRTVRPSDLAVAGVAGLIAFLLVSGNWRSPLPGATATQAVVSIAGRPQITLDLRQDGLFPLDLPEGHMVVEVANGAVRVLESDCPDQICVLTGWARRPGDMVVCVPYRMVLQISGVGGSGGPDAILR